MDGHDRIMARYLKPDLLIIDDFGVKQLPKRSGEYLFEIVMRRYETCTLGDLFKGLKLSGG
jgi:DNA replication protein DnaC